MFTRTIGVFFLLALSLSFRCLASDWSAPGQSPAHSWGGPSTDSADSVATDLSGNVYVAGYTDSFKAAGRDVLITKYDSSGNFKWAKTWGGTGDEYATSVALGPDGYLYVTGLTSSYGAGWYDLFLLQLDTDGNLKWGTTWGGASYDGGHDIGFDATGNIYVVGESYSTGPCCSTAILLKFTPTGSLISSASSYYKGPATYDAGYSLTVDSEFNVIIAGISWDYSYSPVHNSILLLKYGPGGNLIWQENWSTPFPAQDESWAFHSLTTDSAGNIYVGGRHSANCQNPNFDLCDFDALVLKLDTNGNFLWANTWGTTDTYDTAGSVALDSNGNVLVAGMDNEFGAGGGSPSLFTLSYDTAGELNPFFQTTWAGGTIQQGSPAGMFIDTSGNAYATSAALNNTGYWTPSTLSATPGTLSPSLLVNAYSTGTPVGTTSNLKNHTVKQIGVQDTGGGESDLFVANVLRGNGLDFWQAAPEGFWTSAKRAGIDFAVIDVWGGGPNYYPAAAANIVSAQANEIATAANILLTYFSNLPVAAQLEKVDEVWNAIGAPAQEQLKFMVVDVEWCCGESEKTPPSVVSQSDRLLWISKAVDYVRSKHLVPVIYTRQDLWEEVTGCSTSQESNDCSSLARLKLWYAGCGARDIIGLWPFPGFDGWTERHGNQYLCLPATQKFEGIRVDFDYFDPELFGMTDDSGLKSRQD